MEYAAGAAVFAVHLVNTELLRHFPVLIPQFKTVADFDRRNNKIRAFKSGSSVEFGFYFKIKFLFLYKSMRRIVYRFQRVCIYIVQYDFGSL